MKNSRNIAKKSYTNICRKFSVHWIILLTSSVLIFCATKAISDTGTSSSSLETNISTLEMRFFAHNYSQETTDKRIDRLEEFVYGETKTGSQQERITTL